MSGWLDRIRAQKSTKASPPPPAKGLIHPPAPALLPPRPMGAPPPAVMIAPPALPPSPKVFGISTDWLESVRQKSDGKLSNLDEELARILGIPVLDPNGSRCPNPEEFCSHLYHHAKPADASLRPLQIDAAWTYATYGGGVIPLGVGVGKTIITLLCSLIAQRMRGHQRVVLLVPPQVVSQLVKRDLPAARRMLRLDSLNFHEVTGNKHERMRIASRPGPGVFIYTYTLLSSQTGFEELCAIAPTCVICDEAHNISRVTSARTKRFHTAIARMRDLLQSRQLGPDVQAPNVEVVTLSGTLTKKKIEDFAHLCRVCLGTLSPIPIKDQAIFSFGSWINAEATAGGITENDNIRIYQLIEWSKRAGFDPWAQTSNGVPLTLQEAAREALQHRLRTSPGVVSTVQASVDCSLIISWKEPPFPNTEEGMNMRGLMVRVSADMVTPDGDPIEFAMHSSKWLWELSSGFYNSLIWPTEDQLIRSWANKGKPITEYEAEGLLQAAQHHHKLLQDYHKKLRKFLDLTHVPGCDTPMLVAAEIVRQREGSQNFRLNQALVDSYWLQKEAHHDDLPSRLSTPVRVCDYRVVAAAEWCKQTHIQKEGALVWFHHPEVGKWLHELLVLAEVKHTCAFAGQNEAAFSEGIVLASYAHHVGKNLQHQRNNLILELRREADIMEQTLGRTHRSGQKADEVLVDLFLCNGFDLAMLNSTLRDADYAQSIIGTPQRLCYATYSPVIPFSNPRLAARLGLIRASVAPAPGGHTAVWDSISRESSDEVNWADVFAPPSESKFLTQ